MQSYCLWDISFRIGTDLPSPLALFLFCFLAFRVHCSPLNIAFYFVSMARIRFTHSKACTGCKRTEALIHRVPSKLSEQKWRIANESINFRHSHVCSPIAIVATHHTLSEYIYRYKDLRSAHCIFSWTHALFSWQNSGSLFYCSTYFMFVQSKMWWHGASNSMLPYRIQYLFVYLLGFMFRVRSAIRSTFK